MSCTVVQLKRFMMQRPYKGMILLELICYVSLTSLIVITITPVLIKTIQAIMLLKSQIIQESERAYVYRLLLTDAYHTRQFRQLGKGVLFHLDSEEIVYICDDDQLKRQWAGRTQSISHYLNSQGCLMNFYTQGHIEVNLTLNKQVVKWNFYTGKVL